MSPLSMQMSLVQSSFLYIFPRFCWNSTYKVKTISITHSAAVWMRKQTDKHDDETSTTELRRHAFIIFPLIALYHHLYYHFVFVFSLFFVWVRLVKTYVLCVFGGRENPVSVAWVCNLSTVGQATPGIDGVYKDQSTSIKRSELHSGKGREMNNNNQQQPKRRNRRENVASSSSCVFGWRGRLDHIRRSCVVFFYTMPLRGDGI